MTWTDPLAATLAPSPDDFAALARRAFDDLPEDFRRQAGALAFRIDDFATDAVLDEQGVEDPFALTGLLQGGHPGPPTLVLYRRPILDEWCERGDIALGELVAQVVADELGQVAPSGAWPGEGWSGVRSPSLADFAALAAHALANLPLAIKAAVGDVQIRVEDFADDETLDALEIEDAFELTGVYEGVDLPRRSVFDVAPSPSSIRLFRRPILDEWCEGEVGFQALVEHVFVHEAAHHFGFSDAGIEHVEQS
ncbi:MULTISPECIES: metallopeptidase family protein [unclassified Caulobacter]|uniref:metallopeptidase family protein n=1 Tax=Caulobacter sp. UNC279MFTsu5.1 TaxID=1502775 RepID=UPI00037A886F|nr:Predicted Zn-dependent protease, minimal metalloprotease (MMP)-like domain [Caulobacter sp. UNC279MFTsu5.1]